jgi:hypothetical protein
LWSPLLITVLTVGAAAPHPVPAATHPVPTLAQQTDADSPAQSTAAAAPHPAPAATHPVPTHTQQTAAEPPARSTASQDPRGEARPIDALAWLPGGAWEAHTTAADGRPSVSRVAFEWVSGRKAISYRLVRRVGDDVDLTIDGLCVWHPGRNELLLMEADSEGNLTEGVIRVEGGIQHHEEVIYGADGSSLPVRVRLQRDGDDVFAFEALVKQDGEWTVVFHTRYRRVES